MFCRGLGRGAPLLGARVGVEVLDVIGRLLRLGGRVHQHRRVVAQDRIQLWR